jgi:hypothetical protein
VKKTDSHGLVRLLLPSLQQGVGMMRDELRIEVDRNYDYFQRKLKDHSGQYALLKAEKIIAFYDGPGIAYRAGLAQFPEKIFSVQQVTDVPDELGCMSIAVA